MPERCETIDRTARDDLAERLEAFYTGHIDTSELLLETDTAHKLLHYRYCTDVGVHAIFNRLNWDFEDLFGGFIYQSDLENDAYIDRILTFLRSNKEYKWPLVPDFCIVVMELVMRLLRRPVLNDWEAWPFLTQEEYITERERQQRRKSQSIKEESSDG